MVSIQKQSPRGVLKIFAKFTGKHLCQGLVFNKFASLRPATLFKKRLWHRCFPVNFAKFLRTLFLQNSSGGCFCPFPWYTRQGCFWKYFLALSWRSYRLLQHCFSKLQFKLKQFRSSLIVRQVLHLLFVYVSVKSVNSLHLA